MGGPSDNDVWNDYLPFTIPLVHIWCSTHTIYNKWINKYNSWEKASPGEHLGQYENIYGIATKDSEDKLRDCKKSLTLE